MRFLILFCCAVFTYFCTATEVFISKDADGNIIFSDTPTPGSERHPVKPLPTVPAFAPTNEVEDATATAAPEKTSAFISYQQLMIVSPAVDTVIPTGAAGNLTLNVQLVPALQPQHHLVLLDGQKIISQSSDTVFTLTNLSRGQHDFQAQVIDEQGQILIRSPIYSLHVKRASALHNRPQ